MTEVDEPELVEVLLLGLPIEEQQRASEHFDELLREFALIRDEAGSELPHRLLELRETLERDFSAFTANARIEIDRAAGRGDETMDLRFLVPASAARAALDLGALLDEADEFCRAGSHLLTLATPERSLRFRQWYLGEFARQIAGEAPRPWPGHD